MSRQRTLFAVLLIASLPVIADDPPNQDEPQVEMLGAPSDIPAEDGDFEAVWVEPGTSLHGRPDVRSPAVALVDSRIELAVLERRGHWVRVRYDSWKGWIATRPEAERTGDRGSPAPDFVAWRLTLAREMLGLTADAPRGSPPRGGPPDRLGSFELLTDVVDRKVLRLLARIAGHLPQAYRDRFGIDPGTGSREAVVLFSREDDYRAYEAEVRPQADRGALGHADEGIAVLYVGRQGPEDVAAVLVHELTHVLSRRVLSTALPPWLDEGMANDLAFCRLDGARRLELGSLGGRNVVIEEHSYRPGGWIGIDQAIHLSGPAAAFSRLRERWQRGDVSLELLTDLIGSEFFEPQDRKVRYDASTFFVRYLLDGEESALASPFRALLASVAARPADPPTLPEALGRSWPQLERGFEAWLERQAAVP